MKRSHSILHFTIATALICAAPLAFAQSGADAQAAGNTAHSSMSAHSGMSGHDQMMGEHSMSGTVTSVDDNGMVHVSSAGMDLQLHFPNAAKDLKAGDKITVHLSYSKDAGSSSM